MVNIFYLSDVIETCCRFHCDKHVVKMIVESTQILSVIARQHGVSIQDAPYSLRQMKHPCVVWTGSSLSNWKWLKEFTLALNEEYKYRYDKVEDHKSAGIARMIPAPVTLTDIGITERPQCMPDQYKVLGDPVAAYRNYYIGEKQYFAKWRKREVPEWFTLGCVAYNLLHPETPTNPQQKKALDLKRKMEKRALPKKEMKVEEEEEEEEEISELIEGKKETLVLKEESKVEELMTEKRRRSHSRENENLNGEEERRKKRRKSVSP
jgi:hypothetical protein